MAAKHTNQQTDRQTARHVMVGPTHKPTNGQTNRIYIGTWLFFLQTLSTLLSLI